MVAILPIEQKDIDDIKKWRSYDGIHLQMDYAIRDGGWLDTYCGDPGNHCFAVRLNRLCMAFSILINKGGGEAEFRVAVSPDYVGSGYGGKIIRKTLSFGFEKYKFKSISLIVRKNNPIAINMYKRHGFCLCGETTENIQGQSVEFFCMKIDSKDFNFGENNV